MADSSLLMPGAEEAYRQSRDRLRGAEIDLRDRIEAVAAMRRSLPPGPIVPDYEFIEDAKRVRLSELFSDGKPYLILYHLMYWADDDDFCPMCSLWIDGFNGIAPHVTQRANFVIASRAPVGKLQAWGARREWNRLRLLSDVGSAFARRSAPKMPTAAPTRQSPFSSETATRYATSIRLIPCSRTGSAESICCVRCGICSISCHPAVAIGTAPMTASTHRCDYRALIVRCSR
jgi:hypothetical protein